MGDLLETLSFKHRDEPGYREYCIGYYARGFMSNEYLVGKHVFWDKVKVNESVDDVACRGFYLSMGPHKHHFKLTDEGWKFIYRDLTDYE